MKTQIKIILLLLVTTFLSHSCVDLDLLDNPNALTAEQADISMVLNGAQVAFIEVMAGHKSDGNPGLNDSSMEMLRMRNQFGSYTGPFSTARATSLNQLWNSAYRGVLNACEVVIARTAEDTDATNHLGIAKTLKAFTMVLLVDYFRDVPYSEALQGAAGIYNPIADDGADVYAAAMVLVNEAITAFSTATAPSNRPDDMFFGNNRTQWIKACNTLKLKMYVQQQLIQDYSTEINAIVASGNFIDDPADNWFFQYSAVGANPDSRHPDVIDNYGAAGGNDYMSNGLMLIMKDSKSVWDPRMRYYFYRQIEETPTGDQLPCEGAATHPICYIGDYYWGRDHADDDGVPPDGQSRAIVGIYPAGGAFDNDEFDTGLNNPGMQGAGIFPIWMSSWTKFVAAEFMLSDNFAVQDIPGARAMFEEGIRESIATVMAFAGGADAGFVPTTTQIDTYVTEALANYDGAADAREALDVVMQEFRIALQGNGIEAYNAYRRSGLPSDFQAPIFAAGNFPKSWLYPASAVERNSNIDQVLVTEEVFWGCHPDVY